MAKIHTVQHAQQRYKTKPVLDENGEPKVRDTGRTTRPRHGRTGRPILIKVTVPDRTQPLPPETCGACRQPIRPKSVTHPGDGYRWTEIKTGPYSSRRLVRHLGCGTWQPWELSNSLGAQLAQVTHDFTQALSSAETREEAEAARDAAAEAVDAIAEAKREAASNIYDGFGHDVPASEELTELADQLEEWAGEIRSADVPELPEPEEIDCEDCDGTGKEREPDDDEDEDDIEDCLTCDGTGKVTPEDLSEEELETWRGEVLQDLSVVESSPV